MISFPSCIAINFNPAVFASCHQLNDVILTITREWCIFGGSNTPQCYSTCPPWEHIWMTGIVSGGLKKKKKRWFSSFCKGRTGKTFPWSLRHQKKSYFSNEIYNSEHLKTLLSFFSLRRRRSDQLPEDFWKPLIGIFSSPGSKQTFGSREQGRRLSRPRSARQCFFLAYECLASSILVIFFYAKNNVFMAGNKCLKLERKENKCMYTDNVSDPEYWFFLVICTY